MSFTIGLRTAGECPEPLEWPSQSLRRKEHIFGAVLLALVLVPAVLFILALSRASEPWRRQGLADMLLAFGMWPASLGVLIRLLLKSPNPGLVFTAIRGGAEPLIEVRPSNGVGSSLLIPLRGAEQSPRIWKVGQKRMVIGEVLTQTRAGPVLIARTGSRPNAQLNRWFQDVGAFDDTVSSSPEAVDVDEVARRAASAPLEAPPNITAFERRGCPVWSYRTVRDLGVWLIWPWIALLASWLIFMPMLGLASRTGLAIWIVPVELALLYGALLAEGLTVEFEVRTTMLIRRLKLLGLTLWIGVSEASEAGVDAVALPKSGLWFKGRTYGLTSPLVGGPDVAGIVWLAAAIRASAGVRP